MPATGFAGRMAASVRRRGLKKTLKLASDRLTRWIGRALLRIEAKHVFGPAVIRQGPRDVVATCVVRNGALHVRSFIEHHQTIGVSHIVFLDNGSTDETVDLIRQYTGVTILRTRLPYRWFEDSMKEFLSRRFCSNRWNLCVDIDELWSFPFSTRKSLGAFIGYLDDNGFDTVVCQMLDMFSDVPFGELASRPGDDLLARYPFYDIMDIEKEPYRFGDTQNPEIRMHYGGIRRRVFGTRNGLTKAALVRITPNVDLFVDHHFSTPARNADVTCALLHFPFVDRFPEKVAEAVATKRYLHSAQSEYELYHRKLGDSTALTLWSDTSTRFTSVEALVDQGFLVASDRYLEWTMTATGTSDVA